MAVRAGHALRVHLGSAGTSRTRRPRRGSVRRRSRGGRRGARARWVSRERLGRARSPRRYWPRARVAPRAHLDLARPARDAALRTALPVSATGVQVTPLRSSSAMASPFVPPSRRCQSPSLRAHATWFEPGPWQASHATLTSAHVGIEGAGLGIVVLADVGRVALGAHVSSSSGCTPVQCSSSPAIDVLAGIEMEPALPALRLRARVPRDAERLDAAAGQLDQVLLQRRDAERVLDLVVVRACRRGRRCCTTNLPSRRENVDVTPRVAEPRVREIAEHRLARRRAASRGRGATSASARPPAGGIGHTPAVRHNSPPRRRATG